jgi:anaerobic selenocysteine-containing dehydrogenase
MEKSTKFVKEVIELTKPPYVTLAVSIPSKDAKKLGLKKGSKVMVTINKFE